MSNNSGIEKDNIAILLATYNGYNFLEEQLISILKQDCSDWKLYIHDDGSNDGSKEIITEYAGKYPDKIHLIEGQPTGSAKNNFFYLLEQVDSDYYMFCDQDDVWLDNKISMTFKRMKKLAGDNKNANTPLLVFSDLKIVDNTLGEISNSMAAYQSLDCKNVSFARLLAQNVITGCTVMINRDLRDRMLIPCNRSRIIMHDWWAGLIAARFGTIRYIDKPLILYRQHESNSLGAINTGTVRYYLDNFKKIKQNKYSLKLTRIQAKEFSNTFEKEEEALSYRYAHINKKNWVSRKIFYYRNGIKKSGTGRKIGMFLWG